MVRWGLVLLMVLFWATSACGLELGNYDSSTNHSSDPSFELSDVLTAEPATPQKQILLAKK